MGFTKLSAVSSPSEIIAMLNVMFAGFERAAARNGVFKVQTIGDCFVAVAGIPYVDRDLEHVGDEEPGGSGGGGGGSGGGGGGMLAAAVPPPADTDAATGGTEEAATAGLLTPAPSYGVLSPSLLSFGRGSAKVVPASPAPQPPRLQAQQRAAAATTGAAARLAADAEAEAEALEDAALPPLPAPWACLSERATAQL